MVIRGVGVVLIDTLWSVTTFCPHRNTNEAKLARLNLHIYSDAPLLTTGFTVQREGLFWGNRGEMAHSCTRILNKINTQTQQKNLLLALFLIMTIGSGAPLTCLF